MIVSSFFQFHLPFQKEFEEAKEGLINLDKKYKEAADLIGSYVAEADEMKEQQDAMQQAAADREKEIGELRGKLEVRLWSGFISWVLNRNRLRDLGLG